MASLSAQFNSSLILKDPAQVEKLLQENRDLKRQLATGSGLDPSAQLSYDELEVGEQIGGGGFSLVYKGTWRGTPVAIKKWFDPSGSDQLFQEFREEVMTLAGLRHPNVLQFLGAVMKLPNLCMVTEALPFSLHSVLYGGLGVDFDRKKAVNVALDITRAMVYLHSRKPAVVHRDIKPGNFLLDRAWKVKICDFGLASNSKTQAGAGTPAYMAPELLDNKPFSEKVDVYAFGVMLNEMVAKEPPFGGLGVLDIKAKVLAGERPDVPLSCPKVITDIVKKCWDQDPTQRPSFEQVMNSLKEAAKVV